MTLDTGLLIQADRKSPPLSPLDELRAAIAVCESSHGWRPVAVQVRASGYTWPADVDGIPIRSDYRMSYPSMFLLVKPEGSDEPG